MSALRFVIFLLASGALVYVSRGSLRHPHSHGFFRFWAWLAILALVLLNAAAWFRDPLAWHQIISWTLLTASIIPLVSGLHQLGRAGRTQSARSDAALLDLERTADLVTAGVYRYIRHPLYSSLLLLTWGSFFKAPSWLGTGLVLIATGFLVVTAKVEERENIRYFGPAYEGYMRRTKMFIPFVF